MRIDFYVIAEGQQADCVVVACRLTEKAHRHDNRVFIYVSSHEEARRLDELLWTFRDISFVPHQIMDRTPDHRTPVLIGIEGDTPGDADLLINLTGSVPDFFERYSRVAEFVDSSAEGRRLGRERFRHYRDKGYTLQTHTI